MKLFNRFFPTLIGFFPFFCFGHEGLPVGHFAKDLTKSAEWNRGAQLVQEKFKCAQCHSPRQDPHKYKINGPLTGYHAPNITPDKDSGIGGWSEKDITYFLETGMSPTDSAGGEMVKVIKETAKLTDAERRSIAIYLESLPSGKSTMMKMGNMGDMQHSDTQGVQANPDPAVEKSGAVR